MPGVDLEFGDHLRSHLAGNLARHDRHGIELGDQRHAAVAVVVVDSDAERHGGDDQPPGIGMLAEIPGAEGLELTGSVAGTAGGPAVLLTRRAASMRAHAGQWALPGGRIDERRDARSMRHAASSRRSSTSTSPRPPCWASSTTTRPGPAT